MLRSAYAGCSTELGAGSSEGENDRYEAYIIIASDTMPIDVKNNLNMDENVTVTYPI
jgi:hypothetical protein